LYNIHDLPHFIQIAVRSVPLIRQWPCVALLWIAFGDAPAHDPEDRVTFSYAMVPRAAGATAIKQDVRSQVQIGQSILDLSEARNKA